MASTAGGARSGTGSVVADRPTPDAPSSEPAPGGRPASEASAPPTRAPSAEVDLSIVFDPRVTGSAGWTKLPREVPLEMLGSPGAAILDLTRLPFAEADPMRAKLLRAKLRASPLVDASLIVDEDALCSSALRDAVAEERPARLLVSLPEGFTSKGVACLAALATPRLYPAGCLHRSHQRDPCDGDAEVNAIATNASLRARVYGLASSLSKPEVVARLADLRALEYLALSPGPGAAGRPLVDALPFARLAGVRYLEASAENAHAMEFPPGEGLRFLAQLHTLRWNGEIGVPLPAPCKLERASFDRLRGDDVLGLAACSSLRELSTDEARFGSAKGVAALTGLERVHLRHWAADDLALLTGLTKLRSLSLPASRARDFAFLAGMPGLAEIDLSQTSLATLAPLRGLARLYALDVDFTQVRDLGPLRAARGLVELSLHETQVGDLAVVERLAWLKALTISKTPVVDLRPLAGHPSLEKVTLYETPVHDVSPLLTIPKLKRAHVHGLTLPREQLDALRARLGRELLE